MKSYITSLGLALLSSAMLIGCAAPNEYQPTAKPTQMAAYAASRHYPDNAQVQDNAKITATVNRETGAITVHNFSNQELTNFNLWVNQAYVAHVDRIDPNTSKIFNKADLYNSGGNTLDSALSSTIRKVQIETSDGTMYNAQGPQFD